MRAHSPLPVLVVTAIVGLVVGCGGDKERASVTEKTAAPGTTTTTAPPRRNYGKEVAQFVRGYYRLLNRRDFDGAWRGLAPPLQTRLGPRETWEDGYALTEGTTPRAVEVRRADARSATVEVTFYSDDLDVCGNHIHAFPTRTQTIPL